MDTINLLDFLVHHTQYACLSGVLRMYGDNSKLEMIF